MLSTFTIEPLLSTQLDNNNGLTNIHLVDNSNDQFKDLTIEF